MDSSDVGAVVTERTLIDRSRYERSEYYNDWVRPQGFYHLLGNILRKEGPVSTTLTVLRPAAEGEFDDIERNFCARLTPHLQRAVQMHRQLSAALVARDAAGQALDGLAVGVILVDRSARDSKSRSIARRIDAKPLSFSRRSRSSTLSPPARFRKITARTIWMSSQPCDPATRTCSRIAPTKPLAWIKSRYRGSPASEVSPRVEQSDSYWKSRTPCATIIHPVGDGS
jgi:hypothetical protein